MGNSQRSAPAPHPNRFAYHFADVSKIVISYHTCMISHRQFWNEQPALLLAVSLLIGTSSALFWNFPWNWIFPFLWIVYLICFRRWAPIALVVGGIFYSWFLYSSPVSGEIGYFSIASLQPHQSPFQKGLVYKGMLYVDGQRVPCNVHHPEKEYPKANCDYLLIGKLQKRGAYDYLFKSKNWIPVENTWSLAELRYGMKERFRHFLDQKLQRPRTASFLSSLITGDVEDRSLRYEFGKVGLQHILAISGFHFAILIAFCSFFLGLLLPHRWKIIALLLSINAYFLFVGSVPAVQRSWLMAMLYLVGKLIGRHSTGLNLLGVALLIEVILDPLVSASLGFQLSFLSCVGILLFHPFFNFQLKSSPAEMTLVSQHGTLLSTFFRQALSVNFAVNLAILPLILHYFHQFPLLALLYNLFFPLLVSVAMFGLLVSLLIHFFFPPLADLFFLGIDFFTAQLLDLTAYPPLALDYSLKVDFPAWAIPFYIFVLFSFSVIYKINIETKNMIIVR